MTLYCFGASTYECIIRIDIGCYRPVISHLISNKGNIVTGGKLETDK